MGGLRLLRSVVRSAKAVAYFGWYGLELAWERPKTRRAGAEWLSRFCAKVLKGFNVKVTVEGDFPASGVVISDHLTYLDIIVYASLKPVVYCAKAEVEKMPLLGWMATSAGTVMVERGTGGAADRARIGMQAAEAEGVPVVFFPEGTTTTGYSLLPFKSGLLAVSLEAEQPIRAAHIHYTLERDNGPDVDLHEDVCWGDKPMLRHIFTFVGLDGVHAWVKIAPQPIEFSAAALQDRKVAALEAHEEVLALGKDWYAPELTEQTAPAVQVDA